MRYFLMLLIMCLTMNISYITPVYASETNSVSRDGSKGWEPTSYGDDPIEKVNKNLKEMQDILKTINLGFTGFTILTAVLSLVYHFARLALFSCSIDRYVSMKAIATVLVCVVLLGGIQVIVNLIFMIAIS